MLANNVKKNILILSVCQAIFASSSSILALTAGLVGFQLISGNVAFATVPVSAMVVGTAIATAPAALVMRRLGRRNGFTLGAVIGLIGSALAVISIWQGNFWGFTLGILFIGMFNGFAHHYRFAAADMADDSFRGKAISLVLAGGVFAAFLGPEIGAATADFFPGMPFMGSYIAVFLLLLVLVGFLQLIDIQKPTNAEIFGASRTIYQIMKQRRFVLAVTSSMIGFAVMVLLMTATPIAMIEHSGHTLGDTKFVIQWHVIAMFAPSFFTGSLIIRFGVIRIIGFGMLCLGGGIFFSIVGVSLANFWISLFLLGLGWNFMFVGGSTLLTETYEPTERAKVQGFHDFSVFFLVCIASVSSGILLQYIGWEGVSLGAIPFLLLVLLVFLWTISETSLAKEG